jgi:P-type E1-E2 ATPase
MKADIKVWMLTGDKGATAKQIGTSCGIFEKNMTIHKVEED